MDENTSDIVRVGTVSAVNAAKKQARVIFRDAGITSGWLCVLQRKGEVVSVQKAGTHDHKCDAGQVENTTRTPVIWYDETGAEHQDFSTAHNHLAAVTTWMPKVNDTVIVLYLPCFNSDGIILGGV